MVATAMREQMQEGSGCGCEKETGTPLWSALPLDCALANLLGALGYCSTGLRKLMLEELGKRSQDLSLGLPTTASEHTVISK